MQARFAHVNLIARDWQKLVRFYEQVFGCVPTIPEGNLSGKWLEETTQVPDARIRIIHLRLPGLGEDGPTLEVIRYEDQEEPQPTAANRPGFGHIAFAVEDVQAALDAVLASGGGRLGEPVSTEIPGRGRVTEVYATDPEGNIVELQKWSQPSGPSHDC